MDNVTIDRILLVKIRKFTSYYKGILNEEDLTNQEKYRVCIFMDGELIDFATGNTLSHLNYEGDYVIPEVYKDTMYVEEVYSIANVTDEMYNYAQELYKYYLFQKELLMQKKLILFPKERLY